MRAMSDEGEFTGEDEPVLFVAAHQNDLDDQEAILQMRETTDGQLAIMVYSSLDTLVAGAGKQQPWIAVPPDDIADLVNNSDADGVLLDTVIPPGQRVDAGVTDARAANAAAVDGEEHRDGGN